MKHCFIRAGLFLLLFADCMLAQQPQKLSLSDAIMMALENNPEILEARKEIDAAGGRILQAGRIPNPDITAAWSESSTFPGIKNANEHDIVFAQLIEFPTKRVRRIDVASRDREVAVLNLERLKSLVTLRVKQAYYRVLMSETIIEGLEEQLRFLNDFQQTVTGRLRLGDDNYLDVIRTTIEVTRASNDMADARREWRIRQNELNLLLGHTTAATIKLSDSISYKSLVMREDSLVQSLLQRSATLRIAETIVSRQEQALSLAKSSYLPDFEIGVAHQRRGDVRNLWGVEFKVSVPLWFWQDQTGQVQEAKAQAEIASVNQSAVTRRIHANILAALELVKTAEIQLSTFDFGLLSDVRDILSAVITRYENNQLDVLNLLDVYRTYKATRIEYARALFNYATAVAELAAAAELSE